MAHIVRESLRILFVVGTLILPILYWLLGRWTKTSRGEYGRRGKGVGIARAMARSTAQAQRRNLNP